MEPNPVIKLYLSASIAHHNTDGLIVTGVPLTYHKANIILAWKEWQIRIDIRTL